MPDEDSCQNTNQSDVACLVQQIEAECSAARSGLHGLSSGSSRHDFITARMERTQVIGEQLIRMIGPEDGLSRIIEAMEKYS